MKRLSIPTLAAGTAAVLALGIAAATAVPMGFTQDRSADLAKQIDPNKPKSVILLIGDGMDDSMITAARNYSVGAAGRLALDELPFSGAMTTYGLKVGAGPDYPIAYVSDSAPTASGWSTGKKTVDGRLSQGPSTAESVAGTDYETVLEKFKKMGKLTGDVSTAEITDATPAAAASHINARACQDPTAMAACPSAKKSVGGKGSVAEQLVRVFDLLYGGNLSEAGDDTLAGFNVNSVALQVPQKWLAKKGNPTKNPIIGVWSTTQKRSTNGKYIQVSRLGNPLVNEVVIPLKLKDAFNGLKPTGDAAALKYVTNPELPKLIESVYGIEAPKTPRNDLVSVFLTGVKGLNMPKGKITPSEQLRLNMSTPVTAVPNRLGVIGGDTQGFPNGRRLGDDVIDIALQVVEGELVGSPNDLGDGVDANDAAFGTTFPYLALPASGSNADPHPTKGAAAKQSSDSGLQGILPSRKNSFAFVGVGLLALLGGIGGAARQRKKD